MIRTQRIAHPAFFGTRREQTIAFYRDLLGMELVLQQPNLDNASMEHFFFHVGNDNFIAYFLPVPGADTSQYQEAKYGVGALQHLALDVDDESFVEAQERLRGEGISFSGPIDRGYERSIYFRDPNGVLVELLTWLTTPPSDVSQAEIIRRAQAIRIERGADHVENGDVERAITDVRAERAAAS